MKNIRVRLENSSRRNIKSKACCGYPHHQHEKPNSSNKSGNTVFSFFQKTWLGSLHIFYIIYCYDLDILKTESFFFFHFLRFFIIILQVFLRCLLGEQIRHVVALGFSLLTIQALLVTRIPIIARIRKKMWTVSYLLHRCSIDGLRHRWVSGIFRNVLFHLIKR